MYQEVKTTKFYTFNFIEFTDLEPATTYYYRLNSNVNPEMWSNITYFKSLYDHTHEKPTKLAMFGDMGVYEYNNMGNLKRDSDNGDIDFLVHLGDHAYCLSSDSGNRGDSYIESFSQII